MVDLPMLPSADSIIHILGLTTAIKHAFWGLLVIFDLGNGWVPYVFNHVEKRKITWWLKNWPNGNIHGNWAWEGIALWNSCFQLAVPLLWMKPAWVWTGELNLFPVGWLGFNTEPDINLSFDLVPMQFMIALCSTLLNIFFLKSAKQNLHKWAVAMCWRATWYSHRKSTLPFLYSPWVLESFVLQTLPFCNLVFLPDMILWFSGLLTAIIWYILLCTCGTFRCLQTSTLEQTTLHFTTWHHPCNRYDISY